MPTARVAVDVLAQRGGGELALVARGSVLGDHLVVGAERAVGLAHGRHELVAGVDDGVADHVLATAAAAGPLLGQVAVSFMYEVDLLGRHAQRAQGLVRRGQGADVGALAVVLPGVERP